MASSSSVFGTLRSITAAKQGELEKQSKDFSKLKRDLLQGLEKESSARERILELVQSSNAWQELLHEEQERNAGDGRFAEWRMTRGDRGGGRRAARRDTRGGFSRSQYGSRHDEIFKLAGIEPSNLERILDQSHYDSAISAPILKAIEYKIKQALDVLERKYEYAHLFNQLVTERTTTSLPTPATPNSSDDFVFEDSAETAPVGRSEMHSQRKTWEAYSLSPNHIDTKSLREALGEVFDDNQSEASSDVPLATARLWDFRQSVRQFCRDMLRPSQFNSNMLDWVVKGLLRTDLLSAEQSDTLKEIVNNQVHQQEMADVLNMKISSIDSWAWPGPVPLEMRRQLNGKYRVFMHEEIADALLIHYIGIKFSVFFKEELMDIASPFLRQSLTKPQRNKREYLLQDQSPGIEHELETLFNRDYFLSQLPSDEREGTKGYGEDDLAEEADQTQKNPLAVKQSLLHLIYTDALVQGKLGKDVVILQTDFKWFGPSVSHEAIYATLEFFDVSRIWMDFFRKFLEAPLRFIHDGPDGQVRVRERGVPMSHALSDFFGETVLFHLDHAVQKATQGHRLHRLHDDLIFWSDEQTCVKAWGAIKKFCSVAGLELNMSKTGASRIHHGLGVNQGPLTSALPSGTPKWGFAIADPDSGKLRVDRSHLDIHVSEFRRQLSATTSIFSWVQAYNAYVQFILNNLLHPAPCLGVSHLTDSLTFLSDFHKALFPEHSGSASSALKSQIEIALSIPAKSIPDAFLYFPMHLGGLELRNPFISLHALRGSIPSDPSIWIEAAMTEDHRLFQASQERFEREGIPYHPPVAFSGKEPPRKFLTWEEYSKFRYEYSPTILRVWQTLQQPAKEDKLAVIPDVEKALSKVHSHGEAIKPMWSNMNAYWQAVTALYVDDMTRYFGGLEIVERGLLPMGMVGLWKGGKVRWEG